jgi:excinuclease ABC subunit A
MQIERYKSHSIELVVDRLVIDPDCEERLRDAVSMAIAMSEHKTTVMICASLESGRQELTFSTCYDYGGLIVSAH